MKKIALMFIMMLYSATVFAQDNVVGFWTTVDDETKKPKSIVQIYEYNGHYFGRVVDVLKNKQATAKIPGNPPIIGLDIIWDLKKDGNKYTGGKILDPQKGKVYGCEIWRENDLLIVRGKVAFLGRNQTWLPNTDFKPTKTEALLPKKQNL
ncbi:MAG: DUF2147 domain-containing protein [Alphaproteobacteria bacterium]|nr:DUF2147 domain-containing protein [Alphaproteobacteria bacterium]